MTVNCAVSSVTPKRWISRILPCREPAGWKRNRFRLPSAPVAEDFGAVVPYLHPHGARKYIDFLKRAFGGEELIVVEHAGRVMHAAARIGDAVVEMGEAADRIGLPSNGFFLMVDDVEAAYVRALAAGATAYRRPEDIPYGFRSAIVRDPDGYLWWPARWIG